MENHRKCTKKYQNRAGSIEKRIKNSENHRKIWQNYQKRLRSREEDIKNHHRTVENHQKSSKPEPGPLARVTAGWAASAGWVAGASSSSSS